MKAVLTSRYHIVFLGLCFRTSLPRWHLPCNILQKLGFFLNKHSCSFSDCLCRLWMLGSEIIMSFVLSIRLSSKQKLQTASCSFFISMFSKWLNYVYCEKKSIHKFSKKIKQIHFKFIPIVNRVLNYLFIYELMSLFDHVRLKI